MTPKLEFLKMRVQYWLTVAQHHVGKENQELHYLDAINRADYICNEFEQEMQKEEVEE